jgi:hypothetical protein
MNGEVVEPSPPPQMPPKKFKALRKAKNKPPFSPQTFLSPHPKTNSLEVGGKKKRNPNPTYTFFLNFPYNFNPPNFRKKLKTIIFTKIQNKVQACMLPFSILKR